MNAILILLALFTGTLILSKSQFLEKANAFSFLSVPLLIGFAFSDQGILPFLPSTKANLIWALRVALFWMAFITGVRVFDSSKGWRAWLNLFPYVLGYLLFLEITIIGLRIFEGPTGTALGWENLSEYFLSSQFGIAIVLSASVFSSKENPFLLILMAFSLSFLLSEGGGTFDPQDLLLPLAVGVVLALSFRLILGGKGELETPSRLTLLGLCILGSGWAFGMGSLEVFVGLAFGAGLAFLALKKSFLKDPVLFASEAPVRLIVSFFVGLEVVLSVPALQMGALLALGRLAIKWFLLKIGLRSATPEIILKQILPISYFALPFILCIHLSLGRGALSTFILSTFAVAFLINDLFNLAIEYWRRELKAEPLGRVP